MLVLLGIGFLGGLITGISPCIIPVIPVIVAGGSTGTSRRRPYAIIAGLVVSFSVFTLIGGSLLSALHLPQDFLRDFGIAMLLVLALGLLIPKFGEIIERPFARFGANQSTSSSGLVLGLSLGLVFVPCAGPVLAAISAVAATHRIGFTSVLLTFAYALGAAVPLLIFAAVAQRTSTNWKAMREHAPTVRKIAGALMGLTALAIAFNLTNSLQTSVPGYTSALENHIEGNANAVKQLAAIQGEKASPFVNAKAAAGSLPDLGHAPPFAGIVAWLNTPGNKPLSLASLRGKVVLIDFWTYSCINCERSLPHVEAWYNAYKKDGFVVVGVHTPEFPFEHVVSNVKAAAGQLGVDYPVAVDNNYGTWDAYSNEYWPAEYLLDQNGNVRHTQFGEGDYGTTENDIRLLLASGGDHSLPQATEVADRTPQDPSTPESYIGYNELSNYVGSTIQNDVETSYQFPSSIPPNTLSLNGRWTVHKEEATAGTSAELQINFQAHEVYLVMGGTGTVGVSLNGKTLSTVTVSGIPKLYTLFSSQHETIGTLLLTFSPGVQAYDFTFG